MAEESRRRSLIQFKQVQTSLPYFETFDLIRRTRRVRDPGEGWERWERQRLLTASIRLIKRLLRVWLKMAPNDVLGKLGRSNIKSRSPLLWAETQPNGSIREVLFLSCTLSLSKTGKQVEADLHKVFIKTDMTTLGWARWNTSSNHMQTRRRELIWICSSACGCGVLINRVIACLCVPACVCFGPERVGMCGAGKPERVYTWFADCNIWR